MWYTMSVEQVKKKLDTDERFGLKDKEVLKRVKTYGVNKLEEGKKRSFILKFIDQFKDFMIVILLIAALVSAVMAYVDGSNDYMDSIIIVAIVVFNALMGLIQENKAERSLEALKKLSSPTAKVKRNGKFIVVQSEELVPGDILHLEAGNLIPADARLTSSINLKVEEATLTGEAQPILKDYNASLRQNIPVGDMINMVFASTIVVNGHGEAIVTETGMNTMVR